MEIKRLNSLIGAPGADIHLKLSLTVRDGDIMGIFLAQASERKYFRA